MHGIPEGKRKVIKRENVIQQVILGGVVLACFIYSFYSGNFILQLISGLAVAIIGVVIISYYSLEFITGRGYHLASAINELMYLVIGIPILVISAGFLPASIYMAFFEPDRQYVTVAIFVIVGVLEVLAIVYLIRRYLRDKKMNLFQYLKYMFDFKRRAAEQKSFRERSEQIDTFYDDLHRVEDRIAQKIQEKSSGFEQFDWKEKVSQISSKTDKGIQCWNCQTMNKSDSYFCINCSAPLKRKKEDS